MHPCVGFASSGGPRQRCLRAGVLLVLSPERPCSCGVPPLLRCSSACCAAASWQSGHLSPCLPRCLGSPGGGLRCCPPLSSCPLAASQDLDEGGWPRRPEGHSSGGLHALSLLGSLLRRPCALAQRPAASAPASVTHDFMRSILSSGDAGPVSLINAPAFFAAHLDCNNPHPGRGDFCRSRRALGPTPFGGPPSSTPPRP